MGELCTVVKFFLYFTKLYPSTPTSALQLELSTCIRQCVESRSCLSVFYDKTEKECLHMDVLMQERGPGLVGIAGALYYGFGKDYLQRNCEKHQGYSLEGNGYCFNRMPGISLPWTDARDACQSEGADLVKADTIEKNIYLKEIVVPYVFMLLGGSDEDIEDQWMWTDGTPIVGSGLFATGEPNEGTSANCLGMWKQGWGDVSCNKTKKFICEKRLFR